jgi:uncharacterized protein (TIGR02246 family)
MNSQAFRPQDSSPSDEVEVHELYRLMLEGWNKRNADVFAVPFAEDGERIGFDGSQLIGKTEIVSTLRQIFADHPTAPYVSRVTNVTILSPEVAVLRAIAGMVPPGQSDINPAVNTLQTLIAINRDGQWRIVLFQNTPAQFHGRSEVRLRRLHTESAIMLARA